METLLSKLTDLAYEFFGVVLPGLFFLILLVLLWIAAGPMISSMTNGWVPDLTLAIIDEWEGRMSAVRRTEMTVLLAVSCYFLGQALNWMSRGGSKDDPKKFSPLLFRFHKAKRNYYECLEKHFESARSAIWPNDPAIEWNQFYPVAKAAIAEGLGYSLVRTYQHKYTLHRCVAAIGAFMSWACLVLMIVGLAWRPLTDPRWLTLVILGLSSRMLADQFANSYNYYWQMWGNTVVTEAFALYCTPRIEKSSETKK